MPRLAASICAAAALVLGGCGFRSEPTGATASRFPVTTPDAAGRLVTVARAPAQIVSFDGGATATLKALGVGGRVQTFGRDQTSAAITAAIAHADIVIAPGDGDPPPTHGVPVFRWTSEPTAAESAIARLGLAVGKGAEGVRLAGTVAAGVDAALARAAKAAPVRVLITNGSLHALGPETPIGGLIARFGGTIAVRQSAFLDFTGLRAANPALWLTQPPGAPTLADLRRNPQTRMIEAVRAGRVSSIDVAVYSASPDLPGALDRLVTLLHPGP